MRWWVIALSYGGELLPQLAREGGMRNRPVRKVTAEPHKGRVLPWALPLE